MPPADYAGFGGAQGQGVGLMGPPPMGFHMPTGPVNVNTGADDAHKYSNESGSSYGDMNGFDFSEKTIRRAFIRKVYGILSVQLLLTASIIALFSLHQGVKEFVQRSTGLALFSYIAAIVLLLVIGCCEGVRRKSPHNVILLGLFTLTYGFVIGVISSLYEPQAVVLAAVITTVITVGLTVFAFQTKIDFTVLGGILFCCVLVMFIFGIIMLFLPNIPIAKKIYACLGALLFSVYLIYDTQLMIGGDHKYSISPEEYVFAALNIYMDIIMIFLYILRLFGRD
ncbi:Protein lifeguard 2 [Orchesella cincta]|uniref:Protein lifeguard 2 n=1 Tax=Orchesella cincta TaxID=48709 RepID=A0A1D2N1L4_ORCCI|nr:Protein lifeguard 2 [Orchesella cincta]